MCRSVRNLSFDTIVTTPAVVPPESVEKPALPRDLTVFLIQLSVSLNKARSYPSGHPVLAAAMEILSRHLDTILQRQDQFTIGVTQRRLVIDGLPSDESHPVLRDLAERLHHHQLAAIQLLPDIPIEELTDLVRALATETWRQGRPLGLEPLEQLLTRWPHVSVEPLPLDQLELGEDAGADRQADRVWEGLVNAAMLFAQEASTGTTASPGMEPSGADVAKAIRARRGDVAFDRAVVGWMLQMGEHFGEVDEGSPLHQKVSELFGALDERTLENLLKLGATPEERRRLLLRGSRTLPVGAVLDLLHAFGNASDKRPSPALMRVLGKLATHVPTGRGPVVPGAEDVLRDSVCRLVADWTLADPSSQQHRQLLELLGKPGTYTGGSSGGKATLNALRLVQMGLELGVSTPGIDAAVTEVAGATDIASLLAMYDQAEVAGLDPAPLWKAIVRPAFLRDAMLDDKSDLGLIERDPRPDRGRCRASAARCARGRRFHLAAPVAAESARGTRGGIGPMLVETLPGKPWFVVRNILTLLGSLPRLPEGFVPEPYTQPRESPGQARGVQARVRRPPVARGGDPQGGGGSRSEHPAPGARGCRGRLPAGTAPEAVRTGAAPDPRPAGSRRRHPIAREAPTPGLRDWLLTQVATERGFGWFARPRLRGKSPEMLAALSALAAHFARHPDVARALDLARAAARTRTSGPHSAARAAG